MDSARRVLRYSNPGLLLLLLERASSSCGSYSAARRRLTRSDQCRRSTPDSDRPLAPLGLLVYQCYSCTYGPFAFSRLLCDSRILSRFRREFLGPVRTSFRTFPVDTDRLSMRVSHVIRLRSGLSLGSRLISSRISPGSPLGTPRARRTFGRPGLKGSGLSFSP
jgi:hypothetical protein